MGSGADAGDRVGADAEDGKALIGLGPMPDGTLALTPSWTARPTLGKEPTTTLRPRGRR